MIKEILKGNNIPFKEQNHTKNNSQLIKVRKKRINSVLNDFIKFKKTNLNHFSKQNLFEKTNSMKIFLNNKNHNNSYKKLNDIKKMKNLAKYRISNIRTNINKIKNNNSYSLKRNKDISRDISSNINYYFNFDEKTISADNSLYKSSNKNKKIYFGIGKVKNGKGSDKKKKINLQNIKYDNELFINNLEQEFEIICLKKKLQKLKNNNESLKQELNNIIEKNDRLEKNTKKEQNKREKIICDIIYIFNNYENKIDFEEKSKFKNLLLNLMEIKYNYEKIKLKNQFFDNAGQLLILAKIFNDNKNINKNGINDIYYKIKSLIKLKNKNINDIKQYNERKLENKKYYNFCLNLYKYLNINNLDNLYKYLKNIKSSNEYEIRKIIKMKSVLFDEKKSRKRERTYITSSVDNLIRPKKYPINFNNTDLQNYFNENSVRFNKKNNFSSKTSSLTINKDKNDFFSKKDNFLKKERDGIKTTKNENIKINYYNQKNKSFCNHKNFNLKNNFKTIKRIKTNILDTENIKQKEKYYLYYTYKNKKENIPHTNRTFKRIEIKRINNENDFSKNNLTCHNDKINEKGNNRINTYKIYELNNQLNPSENSKLIQISKFSHKNLVLNGNGSKNNNYVLRYNINNNKLNYTNSFEIKKKFLKLKIPSLKMSNNNKK